MGVPDVKRPSPTVPGDHQEVMRPARPRSPRHTLINHQEAQWTSKCQPPRAPPSPALKVPRLSPPPPLPSLPLSTCLPEQSEPPQRGESISLLFEACFDLLTMEY